VYLTAVPPRLFAWDSEQGLSAWNVYRGSLEVLRADGIYTQVPGSNALASRTCGLLANSIADDDPAPGQAAFYLVTGVGIDGETGLGADSLGVPRPNTSPCP